MTRKPPTPAGGRRQPPGDDDDMLNDKRFQRFAANVRSSLIPKLEDSGAYMAMLDAGIGSDIGVKFAVELGMAIMMDKPIILAVAAGTEVPEHLVRAADEIVEVDFDADVSDTHIALGQAMQRVTGRQEDT